MIEALADRWSIRLSGDHKITIERVGDQYLVTTDFNKHTLVYGTIKKAHDAASRMANLVTLCWNAEQRMASRIADLDNWYKDEPLVSHGTQEPMQYDIDQDDEIRPGHPLYIGGRGQETPPTVGEDY